MSNNEIRGQDWDINNLPPGFFAQHHDETPQATIRRALMAQRDYHTQCAAVFADALEWFDRHSAKLAGLK